MPKSPNQRQRIMALYRMLYENTDSRHGLTMSEILDRLAELEIPSDRRAIYDDIRSLNETFAENPRDKNKFAIQDVYKRQIQSYLLLLLTSLAYSIPCGLKTFLCPPPV